jgi:hypothetical protein
MEKTAKRAVEAVHSQCERTRRHWRRISRVRHERLQQPLQQLGQALVEAVVEARPRKHDARDLAVDPAKLRQGHPPAHAHAEHHRHQQRMDVHDALPLDGTAAPGRAPHRGSRRDPRQVADEMFDWNGRHEASW